MMLLRPHHALCIQKFTGHGYDEAFTRHMTENVRELKERPETPVTIISGCDDLCAHCPNNENAACATEDKVRRLDAETLRLTGLAAGETVPWSELSAAARERILLTEDFRTVCGACEWFGLCLKTPNN